MLRINSKDSPDAAKAYYTGSQRGDYYTEDSEIIGNWGGKGAARLGLSGTVDRDAFAALCDNLHPATGEQLTPRMKANRIIGYDFTFDVPKSVSILYGLSNDKRIMEAYRTAVEDTLIEIEDEVQTRVRRDGERDGIRTTGNMVRAEFIHLTTRPVDGYPDPQLHSHFFVFNSTFDEAEDRWKAGNFRQIKENADYYQAAYHSRLAGVLQEMGLSITRKGRAFEVDGVPESAIQRFSRRTGVIEAEAERRGITDADEKAKLGAITREPKAKDLTPRQLKELWSELATTEERDAIRSVLDHVRASARQPREAQRHRERTIQDITQPARPGEQTQEKPVRTSEHLGVRPVLPQQTKRFELTQEQKEVADQAILHCFSNESVVTERQFKAAVLWYGVESVRVAELGNVIAAVPDLVRKTVTGRPMVTTKQVLAEEKQMVDWVRAGKGAMQPMAAGHVIRDKRFGEDQRAAVRHILESPDRVTGVEGRAGTGKTTLMKETIGAIEAGDKRVVVLAPTAAASREILRNEGFKEADTVEKWLTDEKWRSTVGTDEVLWIDEAGLLSNRDMVRLIELAEERRSRLILSGDTRQHRAVARGDSLQTLKNHADLSLAVVHTVRRQDGIYREAVEAFSDGYLDKGFEKLDDMGAILELPSDKRYKTIAAEYMQAVKEETKLQIVSPTHSEIRRVTTAIRDELKKAGQLKDEEAVDIYRPLHMDDADKADLRSYKPGQAVVMKKSAPGLMPGDRLTIVATDRELLTVKTEDGRQKKFDPSRIAERFDVYESDTIGIAPGDKIVTNKGGRGLNGERINNGSLHAVDGFTVSGDIRLENGLVIPRDFMHFNHGYATTSYVAQGKSAHKVIVAESSDSFPAGSREQWYVSVSRGMKEVQVYTDDGEELRDAVNRSSQRMAALDLEKATEPLAATPPERETEPAPLRDALGTMPANVPSEGLQDSLPQPKQPANLNEKRGNMAHVEDTPDIVAKKAAKTMRTPLAIRPNKTVRTPVSPPSRTSQAFPKTQRLPANTEVIQGPEIAPPQKDAVDIDPEI